MSRPVVVVLSLAEAMALTDLGLEAIFNDSFSFPKLRERAAREALARLEAAWRLERDGCSKCGSRSEP